MSTHRGDERDALEGLVGALLDQETELHEAVDLVEKRASSEERPDIAALARKLRESMRAQFGLLDAALDIVMEDQPERSRTD